MTREERIKKLQRKLNRKEYLLRRSLRMADKYECGIKKGDALMAKLLKDTHEN